MYDRAWIKNSNYRHWLASNRVYPVRSIMKQRCNNINNKKYKNYWWRWITYDKKRETFKWFREDMWPTYKEWLSIDRIDNDWDYCKENCRWINIKEQANNKTTTHRIIYEWKKYSMMQISKKLWINYSRLRSRLSKWRAIDRALSLNKYDAWWNIIF